MKHCDDYIDDENQPVDLRNFLQWARQPAIKKDYGQQPKLFATYCGDDPSMSVPGGRISQRCRVVMASRFGDVGIRFSDLDRVGAYEVRCPVSHLKDFSETP